MLCLNLQFCHTLRLIIFWLINQEFSLRRLSTLLSNLLSGRYLVGFRFSLLEHIPRETPSSQDTVDREVPLQPKWLNDRFQRSTQWLAGTSIHVILSPLPLPASVLQSAEVSFFHVTNGLFYKKITVSVRTVNFVVAATSFETHKQKETIYHLPRTFSEQRWRWRRSVKRCDWARSSNFPWVMTLDSRVLSSIQPAY